VDPDRQALLLALLPQRLEAGVVERGGEGALGMGKEREGRTVRRENVRELKERKREGGKEGVREGGREGRREGGRGAPTYYKECHPVQPTHVYRVRVCFHQNVPPFFALSLRPSLFFLLEVPGGEEGNAQNPGRMCVGHGCHFDVGALAGLKCPGKEGGRERGGGKD